MRVETPIRARAKRLAVVMAALVLAGCAQMEKDVGQCEPGVADISTTATVTPPGC